MVRRALLVAPSLGLVPGCAGHRSAFGAEQERHVGAIGGAPLFQVLPGAAVFRAQVPERLQGALSPDPTPFGNDVAEISGSIRVEATDRTDRTLPGPPDT